MRAFLDKDKQKHKQFLLTLKSVAYIKMGKFRCRAGVEVGVGVGVGFVVGIEV